MTTYAIDSSNGNLLTTGLQGYDHAREVAQRLANDLGATVTLYEADGRISGADPDDEDVAEVASEEICPEPVAIHLAISAGTPSEYYPADERSINGALDYDVTLTIGNREIEGGITLYRDRANGGMSTCGTPLDGWCGSTLLAAIKDLPESRRKAVIESLAALSDGEVG